MPYIFVRPNWQLVIPIERLTQNCTGSHNRSKLFKWEIIRYFIFETKKPTNDDETEPDALYLSNRDYMRSRW